MYNWDKEGRSLVRNVPGLRREVLHERTVRFEHATRIASRISLGISRNGMKRVFVCPQR